MTAEKITDPKTLALVFEKMLALCGPQKENARAVLDKRAAVYMLEGRGFAQVSIVEGHAARSLWVNAAAGKGLYCPAALKLLEALARDEGCRFIRCISPDPRKAKVLMRLGFVSRGEELVWAVAP